MLRLLKRGFYLMCLALILGLTAHEAKAVEPRDFKDVTAERYAGCRYEAVSHVCGGFMYKGDLYLIVGPLLEDATPEVYAIYRLDAKSSTSFMAQEPFDYSKQELVWKKGTGSTAI